jgi:hypothetical protein
MKLTLAIRGVIHARWNCSERCDKDNQHLGNKARPMGKGGHWHHYPNPHVTLKVPAKKNNILITKDRRQATPHDHWHRGISDHHQAWHHCRTAQKKAKEAVHSRDDIRGDIPNLEKGTDRADLGAKCTMKLDVYHKDQTNSFWGWISCNLTTW